MAPSTTRRTTLFALGALNLLSLLFLTPPPAECVPLYRPRRAFSYIANETACKVDHIVYRDGDPVPTDDPCETCRCRPPGFACTLRHCEVKSGCRAIRRIGECCPQYQCGCEHNGNYYRDGERVPNAESPCYSCYCQGSSITCSLADCVFRFDCEPDYVAGECCPRYDHCPPDEHSITAKSTEIPHLTTAFFANHSSTTPLPTTTLPTTTTTKTVTESPVSSSTVSLTVASPAVSEAERPPVSTTVLSVELPDTATLQTAGGHVDTTEEEQTMAQNSTLPSASAPEEVTEASTARTITEATAVSLDNSTKVTIADTTTIVSPMDGSSTGQPFVNITGDSTLDLAEVTVSKIDSTTILPEMTTASEASIDLLFERTTTTETKSDFAEVTTPISDQADQVITELTVEVSEVSEEAKQTSAESTTMSGNAIAATESAAVVLDAASGLSTEESSSDTSPGTLTTEASLVDESSALASEITFTTASPLADLETISPIRVSTSAPLTPTTTENGLASIVIDRVMESATDTPSPANTIQTLATTETTPEWETTVSESKNADTAETTTVAAIERTSSVASLISQQTTLRPELTEPSAAVNSTTDGRMDTASTQAITDQVTVSVESREDAPAAETTTVSIVPEGQEMTTTSTQMSITLVNEETTTGSPSLTT